MHSQRFSQNNKLPKPAQKPNPMTRTLLIALAVLAIIGVFLTAFLIPSDSSSGPSTNSVFTSSTNSHSLSQKILNWIPKQHVDSSMIINDNNMELPPWDSHEVWTPIDIDIQTDPIVILCKLNFKKYWDQPHSYPMFRDLEGASGCVSANRKRAKMSVLLKEIEDAKGTPEGRIVAPTGFVFHESRVGSTLIANFLASDPWALVFSESTPVANAILHCATCTKERQIELFRNVLTLMGRSPYHKRLFIKSQSITTTRISTALEAFPDTPWAFVFRQPVQTMMSHLDPAKGSMSAPCLRSKRSPPPEVSDALRKAGGVSSRTPNEAWCAAHLNMLCNFALQAYNNYNSTTSNQPRGLLINYEALPGAVPKALLPHFHVPVSKAWVKKMEVESKHYSKSRTTKFRLFVSDSEDKDNRATKEILTYADMILEPTFQLLNAIAVKSLAQSVPKAFPANSLEALSDKLSQNILKKEDTIDIWKLLKPLPNAEDISIGEPAPISFEQLNNAIGMAENDNNFHFGHSKVLPEKEFAAWLPFANHHHSQTFFTPDCPLMPPKDYPKTFSMLDIIQNWNPDDTNIPLFHYDSICHFDYQNATQMQSAMNYRAVELPFIMYNMPEVDEVVKKWNNLDYLSKLLGTKTYRTEVSESNHFMYWHGGASSNLRDGNGKRWKPPTSVISTRFEDWLELAVKGQNKSLIERKHQYFRVSSDMGNPWLFKELPFFQPKKSAFIVNPKEQRGIHCRFGMRSVVAEAHWDGSRNAVVMLGGMRRWVLTHPDQCKNMHMYMNNHPSGRHSAVNWSDPDVHKYPNFAKVMGNEVILRPGDYLFVPTYWVHFIVSLNINFQCNTRSGMYTAYNKYLRECGF